MPTPAIRSAQLKLALLSLVESASEAEIRDLALRITCAASAGGHSTAGVADALDALSITIGNELTDLLQRAADHAGFLAARARHLDGGVISAPRPRP